MSSRPPISSSLRCGCGAVYSSALLLPSRPVVVLSVASFSLRHVAVFSSAALHTVVMLQRRSSHCRPHAASPFAVAPASSAALPSKLSPLVWALPPMVGLPGSRPLRSSVSGSSIVVTVVVTVVAASAVLRGVVDGLVASPVVLRRVSQELGRSIPLLVPMVVVESQAVCRTLCLLPSSVLVPELGRPACRPFARLGEVVAGRVLDRPFDLDRPLVGPHVSHHPGCSDTWAARTRRHCISRCSTCCMTWPDMSSLSLCPVRCAVTLLLLLCEDSL